ncbi:MAG TPA: hypothetical protein VNY05_12105 [Candidatus Acidoferrales bacterium]|nr:hypothetical protein [Candidatus Acidoferrales bacterium]
MTAQWTPMRWPGGWKDPATLGLLKGTAIDYLIVDKGDEWEAMRARARQQGLQVAEAGSAVVGVTAIKGEWPGVRMSRGGPGQAMGGPTGVPWVDSNGWAVRLAAVRHPESAVWVDAPPSGNLRITAGAYTLAMADSAAHGGRWVIALDAQLAGGLAAAKPEAADIWKHIAATAGFFAAHKGWNGYQPAAVAGVISDFAGPNEFRGQEMLNLLARAGLHYRILRKDAIGSLAGLKAVIYADSDAPTPELRKRVSAFVQAGGLLITVPAWGALEGAAKPAVAPSAQLSERPSEHPSFSIHEFGKGRIAMAHRAPDAYEMANDAVVLISHRYDLVRFWNGGATGSYYAVSPDGKQAVAHLFFYADRGPDSAAVRIAGPYRGVKICTVDQPEVKAAHVELQPDAVEVHLPQVPQYVALELS